MNCITSSLATKKSGFNIKYWNGYVIGRTNYFIVKPLLINSYDFEASIPRSKIYYWFNHGISKFLAVQSRSGYWASCNVQCHLFTSLSCSQLKFNISPLLSSTLQIEDTRFYYSTGSGDRKKDDRNCNSGDHSRTVEGQNSCDVSKCGTPMTTTSHAGEKIKSSDPIIPDDTGVDGDVVEKKLSLFQKFKEMYRDYWYVLLPVHCVTSVFWYGGFYFIAESGVDIVSILEYIGINERLIDPFRNGNTHVKAGYIAVAFALYKIATPLRYTVTLGGTTVAINYLKKWGYIKPIPKKEQLKAMYLEQKDILMEKKQQLKSNMLQHLKEVDSTSGRKRK